MPASSTPKVTLYFAPRSRASRALWLLEELGVPYELRVLDLTRADQKTDELLALNPMGKVPIVTLDGHPIWETTAITAHLCDVFPEAGLAPKIGTPARADYYRWLSFGTGVMEPAFMDLVKKHEVNTRQAGWGDFASVKRAIAAGLEKGPWLLGDRFTGADLVTGGTLDFFTMWAADQFADIPGLDAYLKRLRARPALRKAREIDQEVFARQEAAHAS
ncbi:MAG: glutathione S-transferase [Rhodovulum sulfidophilum]|uniref:Glutathione S-transferase n=1 Tax=Rhodovulum sulfidophilum TaxID=35806 RepID=A0A2W5N587_RHOSU|nr:MAG: glutathione S-transferase [Rhodovulum sulfidophilum]